LTDSLKLSAPTILHVITWKVMKTFDRQLEAVGTYDPSCHHLEGDEDVRPTA
jgi:hypothetical protein